MWLTSRGMRFLLPVWAGALGIALLFAFAYPASMPISAQAVTSLRVDVDPSGNEATSTGPLQTCRSVERGATFTVDVLIEDVSQLRTWELTVQYDRALIQVVAAEEMFLSANAGSNVLFPPLEPLPDTDGRYQVGASDISSATDSGSGVLVRLTLKAQGSGVSPLALPQIDINGDGRADLGPRLDGAQGNKIGDVNGDDFFDGPTFHGQIAVAAPCPAATPTPTLPSLVGGETPTGSEAPAQGAQATASPSPEQATPAGQALDATEAEGTATPVSATETPASPPGETTLSRTPAPDHSQISDGSGPSASGGLGWPWLAGAIGGGAIGLLTAGFVFRLGLRGRTEA